MSLEDDRERFDRLDAFSRKYFPQEASFWWTLLGLAVLWSACASR